MMNRIWSRVRSHQLVDRIIQRTALVNIAANTVWLVTDKVVSFLAGFLVGAWVARYLGPEQFGVLNYAIAFVALFSPLSGLGLKDILIRDLVKNPDKKDELLGTAGFLQLAAGLVSLLLAISLGFFLESNRPLIPVFIAILAFKLVTSSLSNTLDYWFQSQVDAKKSVWARNIALVLFALVRIGLIAFQASAIAFVWAILGQSVLVVVLMVVIYWLSTGRIRSWRFNISRGKYFLQASWPLLISGIAIIIYMKVDLIMLRNLASEKELGLYAAAVRFSELWYFLPTAVASSFFPAIIQSKVHKSDAVYRRRMQMFFDLMVGIAYLILLPTILLAPFLFQIIYGPEYLAAGSILRVHIWSFLFVSLGVARSRWLIAEDMIRFTMVATITGAVTNVFVNLWLIPELGGMGAAWATVISYLVSAYASTLLSPKLRSLFKQLTFSLLVPIRLPLILRDYFLEFGKKRK